VGVIVTRQRSLHVVIAQALRETEGLLARLTRGCFPLGGNFRSVSVRIGSQKAALAGLPMGWGLSPVFHPCQGQRRTRSHCGSVCTPHHLLLAPCQKRTQEQASGYWITSATARSDGGTARPSAFAVLRLMISSNLLGCSTGISPGFVPRRILSTMSAACRNRLA